mgnify:CR=1 FL=1
MENQIYFYKSKAKNTIITENNDINQNKFTTKKKSGIALNYDSVSPLKTSKFTSKYKNIGHFNLRSTDHKEEKIKDYFENKMDMKKSLEHKRSNDKTYSMNM